MERTVLVNNKEVERRRSPDRLRTHTCLTQSVLNVDHHSLTRRYTTGSHYGSSPHTLDTLREREGKGDREREEKRVGSVMMPSLATLMTQHGVEGESLSLLTQCQHGVEGEALSLFSQWEAEEESVEETEEREEVPEWKSRVNACLTDLTLTTLCLSGLSTPLGVQGMLQMTAYIREVCGLDSHSSTAGDTEALALGWVMKGPSPSADHRVGDTDDRVDTAVAPPPWVSPLSHVNALDIMGNEAGCTMIRLNRVLECMPND
ncbi:hypothetical protein KIPB_011677 [Kipferlia bialata]|uniref:Uncharacterized protein n=1 Tax=Kipferlia bialata TaxID=797122 RepID=A0A9K3D5Y2_9EUKA|nr:hypothetical protein KIPB_011677 [Kipferlia bialata]|eukprot:g11677.t1